MQLQFYFRPQMIYKQDSIFEAAAAILSDDREMIGHQKRLKSIEKTLASAEADKKLLVSKAAKMKKSLERLTANISNLDAKINRYTMLYNNVKADPDFKISTSDFQNS
jgi:septal ring factor EnvC (AmiA/AmiB activator)